MSMSALSILQDEAVRNLAFQNIRLLANMKHEQDEMNKAPGLTPSSLVGTMSPEAAQLYAGLFASNPMGLLTPQITTAALLSNLYPHPTFFPWQLPPMGTASPPISPISPALSVKSVKKINNNNNNNNNHNNNIVSTTTADEQHANNNYKLHLADEYRAELKLSPSMPTSPSLFAGKKASGRKAVAYKKKRDQIMYQPYTSVESTNHTISPGPMTPPTSGSSPQSIGSLEHQSPSSSSAKDTTTANRDKTFTCQTCHRSFGYKHVLQNHERTHTGEKPYACSICSKRFTRDHHLKTHMRLHTGEKPYHCPHCDRKFVQVANLRRHLRVHTGEKPYTCRFCDSKFSDSNQLKAHIVIHQDEKPFRCTTCNADFRRSHQLSNHKCPMAPSTSPLTPAMSPVMSFDGTKSCASGKSPDHADLLDLSAQNILSLSHSLAAMAQLPTMDRDAYETATTASKDSDSEQQEMPLDLSIDSSSENGEGRHLSESA